MQRARRDPRRPLDDHGVSENAALAFAVVNEEPPADPDLWTCQSDPAGGVHHAEHALREIRQFRTKFVVLHRQSGNLQDRIAPQREWHEAIVPAIYG